jgi:hypothetical protein
MTREKAKRSATSIPIADMTWTATVHQYPPKDELRIITTMRISKLIGLY